MIGKYCGGARPPARSELTWCHINEAEIKCKCRRERRRRRGRGAGAARRGAWAAMPAMHS